MYNVVRVRYVRGQNDREAGYADAPLVIEHAKTVGFLEALETDESLTWATGTGCRMSRNHKRREECLASLWEAT